MKTWLLLHLLLTANGFQPPVRSFHRTNSPQAGNVLDQWRQRLQPPSASINPVQTFLDAYNRRDFKSLRQQLDEECEYEDATYYRPFVGKAAIERQFRLLADASPQDMIVINDMAAGNDNKICVLYSHELAGVKVANSRHTAFFQLDNDTGLITSLYDTVEPASKTGVVDLQVLSVASKILEQGGSEEAVTPAPPLDRRFTAADKYFQAWSKRDMETAIGSFAPDCQYEDTVFPNAFDSKEALSAHLYKCAESMPSTFTFVIEEVADAGDKLGVVWHVENKGEQMPYTRGCSLYTTTGNGLIQTGIDVIEPAVLKLGGVKLLLQTLQTKLTEDPVRLVPFLAWIVYMYIVFFSDGILPGANALQLEQRTWEEVRDLSLNFFLVSPLLGLDFSPTVHPVLEGVFNLLLSWAALFAGFLSDDRDMKPSIFPMLPAVVGMQFLTSAFLLPYLTLRMNESTDVEPVTTKDLSVPAKVVESRLLGPILGTVGTGAIVWGALSRMDDFGGLAERAASFWQLMSIDRVGSSFLVDLAIFAAFQGWFIDDDLARRGIAPGEMMNLRHAAKYVPFFGLAAYLTLRPGFQE